MFDNLIMVSIGLVGSYFTFSNNIYKIYNIPDMF